MTPCIFPGCCAAALDESDRCYVHARQRKLGTECETCKGRGYLLIGMIRSCCDRCGGVGLADKRLRLPRRKKEEDPVDARGLIRASEE